MSIDVKPELDELEVTLIGPGFGESVVVHLGGNRWIVVDSCRDSVSGLPAPLQYLQTLGVDPATSVVLIAASHWHDDHIRGLADVVEACCAAKFCCSSALKKDEFIALVTKFESQNAVKGGSGVRELHKIYSLLEGRSATYATADRRLYQVTGGNSGHGYPCEVWSLSPSDRQLERFFVELGELVPAVRETKYRLSATNRNDLSVVLWVSVGEEMVLLGADLEERGEDDTGWSAIVSSAAKPNGKASVFKIPHHGSVTGHNADVWGTMLSQESVGVVSPFNRGHKKLPSIDDVDRISQFTNDAYVTSVPRSRSVKKRSAAVERAVRDTVGKLRPAEIDTGTIRLRKKIGDPAAKWRVELFNRACHVSDYRRQIGR
jgi:hypothetical protein